MKDMGFAEHVPRVINKILMFALQYVSTILDDAQKATDEPMTCEGQSVLCCADLTFTFSPLREFRLDFTRQRNQIP